MTPAPKLERLVGRLRGRRIAVVGDLMLDRYVWGTATRLSPGGASAGGGFRLGNVAVWAALAT